MGISHDECTYDRRLLADRNWNRIRIRTRTLQGKVSFQSGRLCLTENESNLGAWV